jgi:AraC-like DNA-binding protein
VAVFGDLRQAAVMPSPYATTKANLIEMTEVGLSLGYWNSSSFSHAFRKITGQTPSRFRRNFE